MKTRLLLTLSFKLLFSFMGGPAVMAQCISGDCENGLGEIRVLNKMYTGIYKGECKANEPSGNGVFSGRLTEELSTDSIKDEGIFRYGYFMAGQRSLYRGNNNTDITTVPYPRPLIKNYAQSDAKGKGSRKWTETELEYSGGTYRGEIKKGLPNGKGKFTINGDFNFTGTFEDGLPVSIDHGNKTIRAGFYQDRLMSNIYLYEYMDMEVRNGVITAMRIIGPDSVVFTLMQPKALLQWMYESDDDGYYKVQSATRSYTGMINDFSYEGSGEISFRNGDKIRGQFVHGLSHGMATQESKIGITSGLFIRGTFVKGTVTLKDSGAVSKHFPVCVSGNCVTGQGRISYRLKPASNNYKFYEGALVEEVPNGYGVLTEKKDSITRITKGNFIQGMLNGFASYEGNAGIVTAMTGQFEADTLKEGIIRYKDGSSFQFSRKNFDSEINTAAKRTTETILISTLFEQRVNGDGIYTTSSGARVQGSFRNNMLFEGVYSDALGNVVSIGRDISVASLDLYGQQVIAGMRAGEAQKRQEAARYVMDQKRQAFYQQAAQNQANFKEETITSKCTACNGTGYILSGYSVGSISYVSQEYRDNSGNWRRDLKAFVPAHNVTSRTACEACHKSGMVRSTQKKYIGPGF